MSTYIDRTAGLVADRSEIHGNSTVRISTRTVGNTAVVELFEYSPENARPVSKTTVTKIVRTEAKPLVAKPKAVSTPIAEATVVRTRSALDANGHPVTETVRVRHMTFVVRSR